MDMLDSETGEKISGEHIEISHGGFSFYLNFKTYINGVRKLHAEPINYLDGNYPDYDVKVHEGEKCSRTKTLRKKTVRNYPDYDVKVHKGERCSRIKSLRKNLIIDNAYIPGELVKKAFPKTFEMLKRITPLENKLLI